MPELPEVETIRRRLRDGAPEGAPDYPSLVGKCIEDVSLLWERTLAEPKVEEFQDRIMGQVIKDFGRRAKYLIVYLSEDVLVIHLRMSGDLVVEPETEPVAPHHRFLIHLDGNIRLAFNDTRKFGRVWLMKDPSSLFKKLGPEPLDEALSPGDFYARLKQRRRQLKPLLLDQSFIAGIGNIYADEALHRAGLHPQTLAATLSLEQATLLLESIRRVLQAGIEANGASIDWVYRGGDFQNQFQVYQRGGAPCYGCGTSIERIVVGQRGTHFCPQCQPLVVET
jgi:formamidopyrimidine-DNA glycosylase